MKSTGITRKIDELGRIVIPKEIRKNLCIREGESIEIIANEDNILLKKHSQISRYSDISKRLVKVVSEVYGIDVIITDRDKVIACTDSLDVLNKNLSDNLKQIIDNRNSLNESNDIYFDNVLLSGYFFIKSIIEDSDSIGLVIIRSNSKDFDNRLLNLIVDLIVK